MTKFFSIVITSILSGSIALACHGDEVDKGTTPQPGDKTKQYCLSDETSVCSFIWFQSHINSNTPGKFVVKVLGADINGADVKVDLWMDMGNGHGHGSAPVKMTEISQNTYQIEEAHFIMAGEWLVRVQFTLNGKLAKIEIPVYVSE